MEYCSFCKKVIKSRENVINCGRCNDLYHGKKDCCGISNDVAKNVMNYKQLLYICNNCDKPGHDETHNENESIIMLDKQCDILNALKNDFNSLRRVIEDQDQDQPHNCSVQLGPFKSSLDKIFDKMVALDRSQQSLNDLKKNNDSLIITQMKKMQGSIDIISNKLQQLDDFSDRFDDVLLKLEMHGGTYDNNFDVFNQLAEKINLLTTPVTTPEPAAEPVRYCGMDAADMSKSATMQM